MGSGQGPVDPNPPGVPTITTVTMGSEGLVIEWEGVDAVDVEYSPLQAADGWQSIASGVQGGRFEDTDAGRGAEPTGFYRLQPAAQ